ncbi:MAG: DNA-3-methyladenine glycosylase [Methanomicrobiales archaeon]
MSQTQLDPVPPYDFDLSARIFSRGDPAIRVYDRGVYRQAIDIQGNPTLVEVRSVGTTDSPRLWVTATRGGEGGRVEDTVIKGVVSSMFNIYDDLAPFYNTVKDDTVMKDLTRRFYGLKSPTTPTLFEALVDSIIEQQISLNVAHGLQVRLIKKTGKRLETGENVYYCYPSPESLATAPESLFRECGMTRRKGEYIKQLSAAIVSGDLDLDKFRTYEDTGRIIREMMEIRGIGKWTAELTIIRGIHKLDAFPADDVGLQRILSRYYRNGKKVTSDEARVIAGGWGAWQGLAAFYLDLAEFLGLVPGPAPLH